MAVKIFCNCCENFIRNAKPNEIANLKGTEICEVCADKMAKTLDDIETIYKRFMSSVQLARDTAKGEIEEARRRVIEPSSNT